MSKNGFWTFLEMELFGTFFRLFSPFYFRALVRDRKLTIKYLDKTCFVTDFYLELFGNAHNFPTLLTEYGLKNALYTP